MPKSAHSFLGCAFFCYHDSKKAMQAKDGIDLIDLKTNASDASVF